LRQAISSLNVTRECFRFVPHEDFREEWNDSKLYAKYGLTPEEITLVENTIRPMMQGGDDNG
jgi:site-specific DNA-methyltransferase (adenine-specific)